MTILERGVPADRYLGQSLYENWLIRPWPGSAEFEFRDISYSDTGLAVYHGWLPLYAIAGSFRLFGVRPAAPGATRPLYDADDRRRRTVAARAPSVLFGALGVIAFYMAGVRLHSRSAGLIAASLGAFLSLNISYSQTARYYAATATVTTLCMWATVAMRQTRQWRHYIAGAAAFSLLFYTHLLTFAIAVAIWAIDLISRPGDWKRIATKTVVFAAIILLLCAPWIVATNFLRHNAEIPRAWTMMRLPRDLMVRKIIVSEFGAMLLLAPAAFACLSLSSPMRARLIAALRRDAFAFVFVYLWLTLAYLIFVFNIPAPSFAVSRLGLVLSPATVLLTAMIFCSVAQALTTRLAKPAAFFGALVFIFASNYIHPHSVHLLELVSGKVAKDDDPTHNLDMAVAYLETAGAGPATRLYSSPNLQHILTFYTGMAFQSIAPVRKSFLDTYPADIIFVFAESFWRDGPLSPERLKRAAAAAGLPLDDGAAAQLSCRLTSLDYRSRTAAHVARIEPPTEPIPVFAEKLWREQQQGALPRLRRVFAWFPTQFVLSRDVQINAPSDWWFAYYYALADPDRRRLHPNYLDRLRDSTLTVMPCADWVAYYSPGEGHIQTARGEIRDEEKPRRDDHGR